MPNDSAQFLEKMSERCISSAQFLEKMSKLRTKPRENVRLLKKNYLVLTLKPLPLTGGLREERRNAYLTRKPRA